MSERVEIARVTGSHGLKGRLRVTALGGTPEHLARYSKYYIGSRLSPSRVISLEIRKRHAVIALEGVETVDQARALKGELLSVSREDLPDLEEDWYYWRDLVGLVVEDCDGRRLGTVVRLFPTGSNDVLEVEGDKSFLVPFTSDAVKEVSVENGRMVVDAAFLADLLD
ncbi:MAG TPA: ribosome maturation factor RimM [Deltaproteobacteria bacterium]|nr:ribosome maturation factor RimM [Deltaproteobacteria bacterium]HPP81802.1 ribosome maturation factor RimM [Deltaproteobacteria bacterium]